MLEVGKTTIDIFGILPRFYKNLLESKNLACLSTARKKCIGFPSAWVQLSMRIYSKHLACAFPRILREKP